MPFSATRESLTCLAIHSCRWRFNGRCPILLAARPGRDREGRRPRSDKHARGLDWVAIGAPAPHQPRVGSARPELADHRLDVQRVEPWVLMESLDQKIGRGALSSRRHQNARKLVVQHGKSHGSTWASTDSRRWSPTWLHTHPRPDPLARPRAVLRFCRNRLSSEITTRFGQREHRRMRSDEPLCDPSKREDRLNEQRPTKRARPRIANALRCRAASTARCQPAACYSTAPGATSSA